MNQENFVAAVQAAVAAPSKSGSKWNQLEGLFAQDGLRGNGAINNGGGADRTTRIRQLATSKIHSGHTTRAQAEHSIFVIGGESLAALARNEAAYLDSITESIEVEHPDCRSCLVLVARDGQLIPKRLIQRSGAMLPAPYLDWWAGLPVATIEAPLGADDPADQRHPPEEEGEPGVNAIYFGPPGTGKSMQVKTDSSGSLVVRTQFHPEYAHADFVGSYRPVVGREPIHDDEIEGFDGVRVRRPVNYFSFVPGPLTKALELAFGRTGAHPPSSVCLIVEEINRGDCAAIFGDIFQLLDRREDGRSEFGIDPKPELSLYLSSRDVEWDVAGDGKLYLPRNLSILATMNTSDQSLFPMDSAFKRRWEWKACSIDFGSLLDFTSPVRPFLDDGFARWDWIKLIESLNDLIVEDRLEDKQIGPWFIRCDRDGEVSLEAFLNKCLFYLWHDVFRDEQLSNGSPFKKECPKVFGEVQSIARNEGLTSCFKEGLLTALATDEPPGVVNAPAPTQ